MGILHRSSWNVSELPVEWAVHAFGEKIVNQAWRRTAAVVAALLIPAATRADSVALTPAKDNTLFSNGNSNGAGDSFFSGRTGTGIRQRGVLAFPVAAGVPAGSTITSATLTVTLLRASPNNLNPQTHALHRLLADWGEGGSSAFAGTGAAPQPGDATWTHTFFPAQFWVAAGGDFDPAPSAAASIGVDPDTAYTWSSTPGMVADVQGWLDSPATNFGWLVLGNEGDAYSARKFASREYFDPSFFPTLTVEFTPPGSACPADCGDPPDGQVDVTDLLRVLAEWGLPDSPCEIDGSGVVDVGDLLQVLADWGPCG
jgi:hypothetical protein